MNLDVVISYFIEPKAAFTGNGVTVSNAGIRKAFEKYNSRFSNMNNFFKYLSAHHKGFGDKYWQSLMSSWSMYEHISLDYKQPRHMRNFEISPQAGHGILLKSVQPKTGLDSHRIAAEHEYKYGFPYEKEVSLVGGVDPEMIQEATFQSFSKSRSHYDNYSFSLPTNGLVYTAKRISFNKLRIKESNSKKVKIYDVLIKPDGSYQVYAD